MIIGCKVVDEGMIEMFVKKELLWWFVLKIIYWGFFIKNNVCVNKMI